MANSREKKTRNVFTEKAALEQEIAALRESLSEQAKRLAQCRKEIEDAIVERIKRLAEYEPPAEPAAEGAEEASSPDTPDELAGTREEDEFFAAFRIYVVGGTEKWQKKAAEVFPTMHFLGSEKNFDSSALAQADYVIINTNAVSHACTEKAKNAAPKSAAIIMTSNNNLSLLRQKLLETIQ